MKAAQVLLIMSIFSFLFGGCKQQAKTSQIISQDASNLSAPLKGPPEITSESEEGFHDLVFYIDEHKTLPDATQVIRCSGVHKGKKLGLEIVLGSSWKAGALSKDVPLVTYQGVVTYRSTGVESDLFLQILDELYGTKLSPKEMRKEIAFTGITLGGNPQELTKEPVKIKLFFESDVEENYAELYTNIELATRRLFINEKDEEYRKPIVKALSVQ